jgi:hypothetical protein
MKVVYLFILSQHHTLPNFVCVCVCAWIGEVTASRNKLYYFQNIRVTSNTLALHHHYCFSCFRVWHTQVYCASSDVFINEKLALKGISVGTAYCQSFTSV